MTIPILLTSTVPSEAGWYLCQHLNQSRPMLVKAYANTEGISLSIGGSMYAMTSDFKKALWSPRLEIHVAGMG